MRIRDRCRRQEGEGARDEKTPKVRRTGVMVPDRAGTIPGQGVTSLESAVNCARRGLRSSIFLQSR